MNKREVVRRVLSRERPSYVPWQIGLTLKARQKLHAHYGKKDLENVIDNHFVRLGSDIGFFEEIGNNRFRDVFGVVWDRTIDKDIGNVEGKVLAEPTLKDYEFPDPLDKRFFADIPGKLAKYNDRFRVFQIGFSLYERAWTLRGMEQLMMDFYDHPDFVVELLDAIADYNIAQVNAAMEYDIDAVYFGDDWGQQHGLQMGPPAWRQFIKPVLKRMYDVVKKSGKFVLIHSCGDVDEVFDDLVSIGLDCFNPFQPEVMNVFDLLEQYRGKLAFHGGLSTQKTLAYGTVEDVKKETRALLKAGRDGGYIFAPAHDVQGDVPLENMLAFIEVIQQQPGYDKPTQYSSLLGEAK
jgi:uroporphyrinogen decarboxylase